MSQIKNGLIAFVILFQMFSLKVAIAGQSALDVKSMEVYGVEIKIDPAKIDPESKRYLNTLNCQEQLKKVFPDNEKLKKLPSEVFTIIKKQMTASAIKFDKMIMAFAKKEALRAQRTKAKEIQPTDLLLELSEFIKDGNYQATKTRFSTITESEFKKAYTAHLDFLLLMTLRDQIPD